MGFVFFLSLDSGLVPGLLAARLPSLRKARLVLVGPEVEKKELPATFQLKIANLEAVFSLVQAGYKEFSNSKGWVFIRWKYEEE